MISLGVVRNVLSDHLFDSMMNIRDAKALWGHLNTTYGASDVGKELYIMQSFHDYKMVANKSIVEQDHEIQRLAKKLNSLSMLFPMKLWLVALLQSCLLHGGTSPQALNTRE
jgi:hypothetical protein